MSRTFLKITLILAIITVLAGGTIAVTAAAGDDTPVPAATRLPGDTCNPVVHQFDLDSFVARVMLVQNRIRVEALLTRAQNADLITEAQSARILNAWDGAHPDWKSPVQRIFTRLMQLQNRDRVEALLTRAEKAGLITEAQAARVLSAWDGAHADLQAPAAEARIL